VSASLPRVFRISGWFKLATAIAALLMSAAGGYFVMGESRLRLRVMGAALIAFGIIAFIDALISRIILDHDSIRIVSVTRRQSYRRGEFESAKVDGGQVCLKKRDGGWLTLPGTGNNALSVRNVVDAWIKSA